MPRHLVAHHLATGAEADLDSILRNVIHRPIACDGVAADRGRRPWAVHCDPALLVERNGVVRDRAGCAGTGRAGAVVDRNAVLRTVERVFADVLDRAVGHIHRGRARTRLVATAVDEVADHENTEIVGAVNVDIVDGSAGSRSVEDPDVAACRVNRPVCDIAGGDYRRRHVDVVAVKAGLRTRRESGAGIKRADQPDRRGQRKVTHDFHLVPLSLVRRASSTLSATAARFFRYFPRIVWLTISASMFWVKR